MVTFNELLNVAREKNASDLHLTVGLPPKVRIDGELVNLNYPRLAPSDVEDVVLKMMDDKQREIFEQNGEIDFAFSVPQVGRFRTNVYKQRGSVACSMRIVGTTIPSPEQLGIPQQVVDLCNKKRGLVLVTGPTGSGRSTTLAALINRINQERNAHVITLEDPIEYLYNHDMAMVNQREIGIDTTSYAKALRAALREDPDVILVGELRDLETISTAITAAETGHLVFSALNTIGAVATIDRLIEVFPEYQQSQIRIQLSSVLKAIVSQQLVPAASKTGRVAAFEVMHGTTAVRNLIREGRISQIDEVLCAGKKEGMTTMDDALIDLCLRGKITAENAIGYAQDAAYVEKRVNTIFNI